MQKKKGISLIVLVITIIVMVILAGAIILTLNNSGIINKASEAVDATNEATVKELAAMGWTEAYLKDTEEKKDDEYYLKEVIAYLKAQGITEEELGKYTVTATENGVEVKEKTGETVETSKWVQEGFTVVKGKQVLQIGDSIEYDETAGGTKTVATDVDWKVLGADEEGNLLIMSAADIKTGHRLGYEDSMKDSTASAARLAEGQKDWLNGSDELDDLCEPYGYGEGVVGLARSIRVEDVGKVTGYDKTTYGIGKLNQYGNEVKYSYNGTTKPAYTSATTSGTLMHDYTKGFHYYNGEEFVHITNLTTGTSGNVFATIISDAYVYSVGELTTISKENNAKAYSMIFGNDDAKYWLASPCVFTGLLYPIYGIHYVKNGGENYCSLWASDGEGGYTENGVRAVVTLSSDITFTGSSATSWSY